MNESLFHLEYFFKKGTGAKGEQRLTGAPAPVNMLIHHIELYNGSSLTVNEKKHKIVIICDTIHQEKQKTCIPLHTNLRYNSSGKTEKLTYHYARIVIVLLFSSKHRPWHMKKKNADRRKKTNIKTVRCSAEHINYNSIQR